jgi:NTP pyrophosphatase (non-canonical NTP hydrolase)
MQLDEFIEQVNKTKPPFSRDGLIAAMGLVTEAAEIMDLFKKKFKYGAKISPVDLKEEIGDVLNYIVQLTESRGYSVEECMDINIKKMKVRYPKGFSASRALKRNVTKEKKAMGQNRGKRG